MRPMIRLLRKRPSEDTGGCAKCEITFAPKLVIARERESCPAHQAPVEAAAAQLVQYFARQKSHGRRDARGELELFGGRHRPFADRHVRAGDVGDRRGRWTRALL